MKLYALLLGFCFIIGLLYSAFNNELLILRLPTRQLENSDATIAKTKKKIMLCYWHHEAWHNENSEILWSDSKTQNLTTIVNAWLAMLDEEGVMDKKVSLESILLSATGTEAFISFDSYPFLKESSTHEKWQWIEGLLKTIRTNKLPLQNMRFLIHHQELLDAHLDFSQAWPINGFLN